MRSESLVKYSGMLNDFGSCMCLTCRTLHHSACSSSDASCIVVTFLCSVTQVQNPKQFSHGGHSCWRGTTGAGWWLVKIGKFVRDQNVDDQYSPNRFTWGFPRTHRRWFVGLVGWGQPHSQRWRGHIRLRPSVSFGPGLGWGLGGVWMALWLLCASYSGNDVGIILYTEQRSENLFSIYLMCCADEFCNSFYNKFYMWTCSFMMSFRNLLHNSAERTVWREFLSIVSRWPVKNLCW